LSHRGCQQSSLDQAPIAFAIGAACAAGFEATVTSHDRQTRRVRWMSAESEGVERPFAFAVVPNFHDRLCGDPYLAASVGSQHRSEGLGRPFTSAVAPNFRDQLCGDPYLAIYIRGRPTFATPGTRPWLRVVNKTAVILSAAKPARRTGHGRREPLFVSCGSARRGPSGRWPGPQDDNASGCEHRAKINQRAQYAAPLPTHAICGRGKRRGSAAACIRR
jgi:hypothetical protein